ncbi:MAG: FtsX-like permease family protein, partial [bacterium]
RAIAKNPRVVLADEPTGNLDANNTFEIMGIIKKISQTCLVILVSHEKDLVDFYADRVLEIKDGKIINDYENIGNRTLEHIDDRNIYLLDLEKETAKTPFDVTFYHKGNPPSDIEVKVIHFNNTVYIKANAGTKIKYLTDDSEIRLLDAHYKKPETEDVDKTSFDLTQFGAIDHDVKRSSFIRFRDTLLSGFLKVFNGRKFFGKLFLVAYFVVSCLIVYNLATFGNLTRVDASSFMEAGKNYIDVTIPQDMTSADVQDIIDDTGATFVSPYNDSLTLYFKFSDFYQGSGYRSNPINLTAFPIPLSQIGDYELLAGALPADNHEAAIDAWLADLLLKSKNIYDLGVKSYDDLLGTTIFPQYGYSEINAITIVGIVASNAPVVILTDANILFFSSALQATWSIAQGSAVGDYEIIEGRDIISPNEILIAGDADADIGDDIVIGGIVCEIVGKFDEDFPYYAIVANEIAMNIAVNAYLGLSASGRLLFYAEDVSTTVTEITTAGYEASDAYGVARAAYIAGRNASIAGRVSTILVTLGGVVVYIFFMTRSSMLGRIKEVGIYRSIGATKNDIYKIFLSEIIAFTTIGSLSGYLFMAYVLNEIQKLFGDIAPMFYLPITMFVLGIAVIYAINIIFGMIPIFTLLRKTPAEINAKYDI